MCIITNTSVCECVSLYLCVQGCIFVCIRMRPRRPRRLDPLKEAKNLIIDVFMFSVENENIEFLLLPVNVYRYQRPKDDRIRLIYLPRWLLHCTHTDTPKFFRTLLSLLLLYSIRVPFVLIISLYYIASGTIKRVK